MAMRSIVRRISLNPLMEGTRRAPRFFSDGKVFGEEEKAAENIYIKRVERERLEKLKLKEEKQKAAAEKEKSEKKAEEDAHKG
ncbi:hypothetical protein HHK36_019353 [Tetracentron sinense]|uniref:Mitochondrial ATPase inhibitor n=1 Tax=Tetracentron sinense TaxID=13715 RepID=A0A834Z226_TETSI|nr:hypothetical protein HHK36_019353 [Tetracentron sinense]